MNRRKVFKAISGPLAGLLVTAAVTDPADNPHTELKQHEEEPRLTYDNAYSTTSMVLMNFPAWDSSLADIPVAVPHRLKKK
jgi:hypothetical protein